MKATRGAFFLCLFPSTCADNDMCVRQFFERYSFHVRMKCVRDERRRECVRADSGTLPAKEREGPPLHFSCFPPLLPGGGGSRGVLGGGVPLSPEADPSEASLSSSSEWGRERGARGRRGQRKGTGPDFFFRAEKDGSFSPPPPRRETFYGARGEREGGELNWKEIFNGPVYRVTRCARISISSFSFSFRLFSSAEEKREKRRAFYKKQTSGPRRGRGREAAPPLFLILF
jgi:hypothetical protein